MLQCLEREPSRRPQTMREVRGRLDAIVERLEPGTGGSVVGPGDADDALCPSFASFAPPGASSGSSGGVAPLAASPSSASAPASSAVLTSAAVVPVRPALAASAVAGPSVGPPRTRASDPSLPAVTAVTAAKAVGPGEQLQAPASPSRDSELSNPFPRVETELLVTLSPPAAARALRDRNVAVVVCAVLAVGLLALLLRPSP